MKKKFYESELEKFKLADGTDASKKFDEKFVEFMEHKEDFDTILEYDGPHPKVLGNHPQYGKIDWHYDSDMETGEPAPKFKNWKDNFVYAAETLPTIALFMMGPWQKTPPFYNVIKV